MRPSRSRSPVEQVESQQPEQDRPHEADLEAPRQVFGAGAQEPEHRHRGSSYPDIGASAQADPPGEVHDEHLRQQHGNDVRPVRTEVENAVKPPPEQDGQRRPVLVVRVPDALGVRRRVRQAPPDQEVPLVAKEPKAPVQPGPEGEGCRQAGHVGHRRGAFDTACRRSPGEIMVPLGGPSRERDWPPGPLSRRWGLRARRSCQQSANSLKSCPTVRSVVAAPTANGKIVSVRVVSHAAAAAATTLTTRGWLPAPRGTSLQTMKMPPPVCFVLVVHKLPTQVGRLVDAVAPCPVLVHVDARSSPQIWNGFQELAARRPQVQLIDRRRTGWASWGAVDALLQALERSQSLHCTHVVHMTGQDYPLRPVEEIASFLGQGPATSWIPHAQDARRLPIR